LSDTNHRIEKNNKGLNVAALPDCKYYTENNNDLTTKPEMVIINTIASKLADIREGLKALSLKI
jgi:hypothetical protein